MKYIAFFIISFILISSLSAQMEIETFEKYSNSYQYKESKGDIYLVVAFPDEVIPYIFGKSDSCLLRVVNKHSHTQYLHKSSLFRNPKNKLLEYYHPLGKNTQLRNLEPFTLYLASLDSANFSKTVFSTSDKNKLIKTYSPPDANASNKEKLQYYKKTGDRQGQLMGNAPIIEIQKRTSCKVKKRQFRKDGINGQKEMTYGF